MTEVSVNDKVFPSEAGSGRTFRVWQIAMACDGLVVIGQRGVTGEGVCTDSREVRPGQVFFALVGEQHDAHRYVPQAVAAGASIVVVQHLPSEPVPFGSTTYIRVADTTRALLDLAAWHRNRMKGCVLAVTGSYGKTTVKEMVRDMLAVEHRVTAAPKSFNNRIGVALTLLSASRKDDYVVLEMGTNHPGEIDELAGAAKPELGAITAVAEVHLEGLGSLQGVADAKGELIPHLPPRGTLVLNADNPYCMALAERHPGPVVTFGMSEGADVRVLDVQRTRNGWSFRALGVSFLLPVGGDYNVLNAAAALALARTLGISLQTCQAALAAFRLPALRYQREVLGGVTYIQDCYNSNPAAMRASVRSFAEEHDAEELIVVCGDMLELGDRSIEMHRELGMDLARHGLKALIAVGDMAPHVVEGYMAGGTSDTAAVPFATAGDAWPFVWQLARPGDAVLLKGSRGMHLETITDAIRAQLARAGREVA